MRPTKLSDQVFLELPPVLAHYLEGGRNVWLESNPGEGTLTFLNRSGVFGDLEGIAVERRRLVEMLGATRARALRFRIGFEQGRRDAARHLSVLGDNARLALQAGPVFAQLQGRFVAEPVRFEFDLEARTLFREMLLHSSYEAMARRMISDDPGECACWTTCGYLSGHMSEILGRRVITLEHECTAKGDEACRLVSRLEQEWGPEADWAREALKAATVQDELAEADERVAQAQKASRSVQSHLNHLNRRLKSELLLDSIIAESPAMQTAVARARQVLSSDMPVLLVGESGAGRQTLARAMHFVGPRKSAPFEVLDCVGLEKGLLMQELLGFEKEAFPGALRPHNGAVVRANKGTLYLNDVTELDLEAQGVLLQLLRDGTVTPLGAEAPAKANVRIVAGAQVDPSERVGAGTFREDLYYALSVARIGLPPLRERGTDILRMAEAFLLEFQERYQRPALEFSHEAKRILTECAWPGNVRQLRSVVEHAVVFTQDDEIDVDDLPEEVLVGRWKRPPQELTEQVIRAALRRTRNNRSHAADLLGVGRTTLWRAMKRMGLE